MPKIGEKPNTRPYNLRCTVCGCLVEKLISRFNVYGKGAAYIYRCPDPYHNCGTASREGCTPERRYGEPVAHALWDGAGVWEHPGKLEDCPAAECSYRCHTSLDGSETHPGRYQECERPTCEPPFEHGDVATSGDTSWREHDRGPWEALYDTGDDPTAWGYDGTWPLGG
jgi:hypothetical protein